MMIFDDDGEMYFRLACVQVVVHVVYGRVWSGLVWSGFGVLMDFLDTRRALIPHRPSHGAASGCLGNMDGVQ